MAFWFNLAFAGVLTLWGSGMLWMTQKAVHNRRLPRAINAHPWRKRRYQRNPERYLRRQETIRRILRGAAWICLGWGSLMLGANLLSL